MPGPCLDYPGAMCRKALLSGQLEFSNFQDLLTCFNWNIKGGSSLGDPFPEHVGP